MTITAGYDSNTCRYYIAFTDGSSLDKSTYRELVKRGYTPHIKSHWATLLKRREI